MSEPCPKCSYQRLPSDTAPAWQCPACGVAYHKYASYLERVKHVAEPRTADMVEEVPLQDGSVWSLVAANCLVLIFAFAFGWRLVDMMLVYWAQSVMIGVSYVLRILSLEKFSTEDFRINGQHVDPTTSVKLQVATFFCFHYGFFHLGYLTFLVSMLGDELRITWEYWLCFAAFAFNHAYSYRYHRDMDRKGTPNIGKLMFTPYARIIPMHLTIIFGSMIPQGAGVILFGFLKTGADVAMHRSEHRSLSKLDVRI